MRVAVVDEDHEATPRQLDAVTVCSLLLEQQRHDLGLREESQTQKVPPQTATAPGRPWRQSWVLREVATACYPGANPFLGPGGNLAAASVDLDLFRSKAERADDDDVGEMPIHFGQRAQLCVLRLVWAAAKAVVKGGAWGGGRARRAPQPPSCPTDACPRRRR